MSYRVGIFAAAISAVTFACLAVASGPANAKIVSEPGLAQHCRDEASARLNVSVSQLSVLPVEKSHGKFFVYGQTDEGAVQLFECDFDAKKRFLGIKIKGDHNYGQHATGGAPKAAINKCLQMVGVPATIEKVSPLNPGFHEIIIKEKVGPRRVACTVPDDGAEIENWVEMN